MARKVVRPKPVPMTKLLLEERGPRKISCQLPYEDLGRKYMENARARTKADPWDSFIFGLALTMTRKAANHEEVLKDIKSQTPTVAKARSMCAEGRRPHLPSADYTYDPAQIGESICLNSAKTPTQVGKKTNPSWDHFENALRQCTNPNPVIEGKQGVREAVRKHYTFRQQKGPDMLLLEAGCETPVMDIWMMRHVLGDSVPEDWDDEATTKGLRKLQSHVEDYYLAKQEVIKEAKACALPAGVYHVAKWFELAIGPTRPAAEAYLQELIDVLK